MINYIKSEIYRIFHNKSSYLFIIICSLLLMSSNILLAIMKHQDQTFGYATTNFAFSFVYSQMSILFILCIMVASITFGNEYGYHTMKNSVSYGINRKDIYLGKFIVQIIYAIAAFLIILGVYVLTGYLLLENTGSDDLRLLLMTALISLPQFIFAIAVTNCFLFAIDSSGAAIAASCGAMIVLPQLSNILGMKFVFFTKLRSVLPWNLMNSIGFDMDRHELKLNWELSEGYRNYWMFGLIQAILFIIIGYMVFHKKEVK